jgi:hypothetical protein
MGNPEITKFPFLTGCFRKYEIIIRVIGYRKMIEKQEILTNSSETSPLQTKLTGFKDYQEYLSYSKSFSIHDVLKSAFKPKK